VSPGSEKSGGLKALSTPCSRPFFLGLDPDSCLGEEAGPPVAAACPPPSDEAVVEGPVEEEGSHGVVI
jgi:hypothetical protein